MPRRWEEKIRPGRHIRCARHQCGTWVRVRDEQYIYASTYPDAVGRPSTIAVNIRKLVSNLVR